MAKKKIVDPLMQIIRRGAEPKQLALSTALGITLGVFPICGTTVFLCGLAIGLIGKHCHAPTLMLANFVATPIELSSNYLRYFNRPIGCGCSVDIHNEMITLSLSILMTTSLHGSSSLFCRGRDLLIPFPMPRLRLGHPSDALKKVITGQASKDVLVSILHALLGWIIAAPFILATLYTLLVPCFKLLVHRFGVSPSSSKILATD